MAFAVNDVVYVAPGTKIEAFAVQGSRYGRVLKVNPNGQQATYLVRMAAQNMGNVIMDETSLTAVTGPALYNPYLPPPV